MKNKSKTIGGGGYKQHLPNTKLFITELRKNLLDLTIEDFIFQMGWNNVQFYQKIINGYYDKNNERKYSIPTVNILFGGISHAIYNFDNWKNKEKEINDLIKKHFLNWEKNKVIDF